MTPYEGTTTAQQSSNSNNNSRHPPPNNINMPQLPNMSGHPNMGGNGYGGGGGFQQQQHHHRGSASSMNMNSMMMNGEVNMNNIGGGGNNFMNPSRGGGVGMPMNSMGNQFQMPNQQQQAMYGNFNGQQQQQQQQNNMMFNNHHSQQHGNQQQQQQGGYHPMQQMQQPMQHRGSSTSNGMSTNSYNNNNNNHPMRRQHSSQQQQQQQMPQHQSHVQNNYQSQHSGGQISLPPQHEPYNNNHHHNQQQQHHHRPSSSNIGGNSRPQSRSQSHTSSNNSPRAVDETSNEEGGLLSYKHPPNFSEVMGFDFALEGGYSTDQQFLPSGLNGDWQSDRDMRHRREMIQHIVKLLKQKDKNASTEWLTKLPQMVKQLEVSLYRSAPSFEAYSDISTLKNRLQQLAMEIARKTQQAKENGARSSHRGHNRDPPSTSGTAPAMGGMPFHSTPGMDDGRISSQHGDPNDPEWKIRIRHKQQRLLLLHHSSKCPYEDQKCKVTPYCAEMKKLWKHMARCVDNDCRVPHCFSSRSILSHYRKCKDLRCPACGPVRETVRKTMRSNSDNNRKNRGADVTSSGIDGIGLGGLGNEVDLMNQMPQGNNYIVNPQDMQRQEVASMPYGAPQSQSGNHGGGMPPQFGNHVFPEALVNGAQKGASAGQKRQRDPESSKSKHKQQRLLLLRHASKCTVPTGTCTVTPHCAEMKVLWRHIANCKEPQCNVKHCMSSRYVLSHYRKCKDPYCDICGPVRDIIKNRADTYIHDPTFNPAVQEKTSNHPSNNEDIKTKRQKTSHKTTSAPDQAQNQKEVCIPVPTSGEENRAKSTDVKPVQKGAAVSEEHSLLECFSLHQIKTHIESLKKTVQVAPAKLKAKCLEVLTGLQTHEHGWVFASPVDPVELNLDDYFDIIKKPMDLGTVQKKLEAGSYHAFGEFKADVRLTFDNAMKYNEDGTLVHNMAKELKKQFEMDYKALMKQLEKEHREESKKAQACGLCGCEKLNFEPPVFFCNGLNCPSKRIRRNTHFYITSDKQYAWCTQCFNELDNEIDLGTSKITKEELNKRKNDELHEESWVQCDDCERWIHQICGLYNTRQDKENKSSYSCPLCLYEKRKKEKDSPKQLPPAPSANDIPKTKLSDWLEKDVVKKVKVRLNEIAKEKSETENISFDKAYKEVACCGSITIRQVTSTDRKLEVREKMKARYAHKNYPDEFPYRCKCIVVFQNIDGVDVILFALYVYEHGDDNPFPNKKTVYVSYLDSVHFMKPRQIRTFIYHEILISYLDYARQKGFEQAFIWACPPLKGDDYIFYAKPEDQKTPKDVRLRQWYLEMLTECQKREVVGKVTDMYDQYFNNKELDASCVPYFEGDYFPGEAENIIKTIEDGDGKRKSSVGKKKKDASKKDRSTSTDVEGSGDKCFREGGRDPVMQKFCDAIGGMKESFIVAFLNCPDAKPENLVVPEDILEYRKAKLESVKGDIDADKKNDDNQITKGGHTKVLDDDIEEIDCEFFNTRQCFLDLCRGNHYQFDELRRAKHTSMMVLWHLQNREAPKFVQQCFSCNREILSGYRHHCTVCPEFDLCGECVQSPNANRGTCTHKLEPIKVESTSNSNNGLTPEQRKERQRNIQLHIHLIEHASRCVNPECKSSNCAKMKAYLKHGESCKTKASGGCKVCKRIWTLLRIHAQQCKNPNCTIPQCIAIKKRLRQLQQKQQAMDDRRRQEMNRHYRMGMMGN